MALPQNIPYNLMLTSWAAQLNPVVENAIAKGVAINEILLNAGIEKVIPTTLSRIQQGWIITDIMSPAKIYRTQPFNANTLTLKSDIDTTISLWVY